MALTLTYPTASQNANSVKALRVGLLAASALSFILRLLFRQGSLSPRKLSFWIYSLSMIPSVFLSQYLIRIGTPRHEPSTGGLLSSGEDLSRSGIIEWCFDVIYITCEHRCPPLESLANLLPRGMSSPHRFVWGLDLVVILYSETITNWQVLSSLIYDY